MASWIAQVVAALILGQTLFFKFTGAPAAKQIFETLGAEPWGRIGSGVIELLAILLLLSPRRAAYGGLLTMVVMAGALGAHLTKLGIVIDDDGGAMFGMAIATFCAGTLVSFLRRRELPFSRSANAHHA